MIVIAVSAAVAAVVVRVINVTARKSGIRMSKAPDYIEQRISEWLENQ